MAANKTDVPAKFTSWVLRTRKNVLRGIDRLIRFCELILLAGAFQFAAAKTGDALLGVLAFLLAMSALIYLAEYFLWITRKWELPQDRAWWKLVIAGGLAGYMIWAISGASQNLTKAIDALANSSVS